MLKKDVNINIDKTIIWELSFKIVDTSFTGRNPPEEIRLSAKFKESKVLIEKKFKIIKIDSVKKEYKKKNLNYLL